MAECAWCGNPANQELELELAVWGREKHIPTGKTIKILRRRAIVANVCSDHFYSLERRDDKAKSD